MKRIVRSLIFILIAAAAGAGISGCGSHKKVTAPSETISPAQEEQKKERVLKDDFVRMTESYKGWQSVSMPVKARMNSPKRASLSGTLNMEYGKALEINMKMLFITALTIYADNETILLMSKPLDICYENNISAFTAATGLDLRDLQSLLLGQLFEPGAGTASPSALNLFSLAKADAGADDLDAMDIRPRKNATDVDWFFRSMASNDNLESTPELRKLDITVKSVHFNVAFADHAETPAGRVAGDISIDGRVKTHDIDAELISDPSRASWNRTSGIRKPTIPAGMRRMTTEEIFRLLKK